MRASSTTPSKGSSVADHHLRIIRGMAWLVAYVLLAKVVGAAKELVLAHKYGVSELVDAYVLAYAYVYWFPALVAGLLTTALVPVLALSKHKGAERSLHFQREILGAMLVIAVLSGALAPWVLPAVVEQIPTAFSTTGIAALQYFLQWLSPIVLVGLLTVLGSTLLLAFERHENTLFECIVPATLLLVLLLSVGVDPWPLLFGTLLGSVIHLGAVGYALHRRGALRGPTFGYASPEWKIFLSRMGVIALGFTALSLLTLIDPTIAAGLGAGAVSSLGYANRIVALITGLVTTAVARAMLPVLSELIAASDWGRAASTARWWSIGIFLGSIPAVIVVWWLSPHLVRLLFEHGAFTAQDTANVSELVRYGLLQIPFYAGSLVVAQLLIAAGLLRLVVAIAVLNLTTKLIAVYLLIDAYGAIGIQLSTAIMYASSFVGHWIIFERLGRRHALRPMTAGDAAARRNPK